MQKTYPCGFCENQFTLHEKYIDDSLGSLQAVFCSQNCYIEKLDEIVSEYRAYTEPFKFGINYGEKLSVGTTCPSFTSTYNRIRNNKFVSDEEVISVATETEPKMWVFPDAGCC